MVTRRCLVALFYLIFLSSVVCPQVGPPAESRQTDPYTIRMDVEMVILRATVQNHKGVLVSGLGKDDFHVYEDGVLQQITYFTHQDIPVTVGLVVDNSGSMKSKRAEVIAAALAFAQSSNPEDQMFVVNFNEHVSFGLPADTVFTDQPAQLAVALSRIAANGETALYDAMAAALEHLKKGNRDKKVLIVVSDGGDNASKHTVEQIMALAMRSDVIIYTLGLFEPDDPDKNPHVLHQFAKATGGKAFLPDRLKDVVPTCEQIAHDIRNQYTIAYSSTNEKRDGKYRVVAVKAAASGDGRLIVRTRPGYYAPDKPQPSPTRLSNKP
ncbi:MAG: VWA domain-containing protein [Acidobacteriia bacterium]|nr:VWA domain-containing protein [Terriglobia bacterium]